MPDRSYFYAPIEVEQGESFQLGGKQYNHIVNVLRMAERDQLDVVDGRGTLIRSTILSINNNHVECIAREVSSSANELPCRVALAVGMIKQQRFEWMVEKATELGVVKIQPLITDRVVRKGIRRDRLKKKAIAAMEQSERAVLPGIAELRPLDEYLEHVPVENTIVAAQQLDNVSILDLLSQNTRESMNILIGPEGGWSQRELESFTRRKLRRVRLGQRRLRTETAAITAISQVAAILE
ncbi:MAG TPA: RsmE family RNA methyltransferase [bacterium]|nr:RsmE family RNA methyltransferase [bacterium]